MKNYTTLLTIIGLCYTGLLVGQQCNPFNQSNVWEESWMSCNEDPNAVHTNVPSHWIQYDFSEIYTIDSLHIWNYNLDSTQYGVRNFSVYSSLDSNIWVHQGDYTITQATGTTSYMGQGFQIFTPYKSRYLLLDIQDNYGGNCTGISEVEVGVTNMPCTNFSPEVVVNYQICQEDFNLLAVSTMSNTTLSYQWSTGSTDSMITIQNEGTYHVTISDGTCTEVIRMDLNKPQQGLIEWMTGDSIPTGDYYSQDSIVTSGIVGEVNDVSFFFKTKLDLQEDFIVSQNGMFSAYIVDCASNPNTVFEQAVISKPTPRITYSDFIGNGHTYGINTTSSGTDNGIKSISGLSGLKNEESYRFLVQASFGADNTMVDELSAMGFEQWINWQLSIPHNSYFNHLYFVSKYGQQAILYWTNFHRTWWQNILTGEDYLRDRMAYALSQVLVISSRSFLLNFGDGLTNYYDLMSKHAFGNYRDLLYDVTLNPMMGFYLSHLNNPKSNPSLNIFPDENYAREVLQLFSIGLYELNIDGTRKKDAQNQDIPTYDNDVIIQFAKVFTGLGAEGRAFGQKAGLVANKDQMSYMTRPMVMHEDQHEQGQKFLLNNTVVPAGQTGLKDINDAIDNIFNHPNVGPFLAIRLIQRFVKSDPSPAYVQRVAEVFNDNGQGVRGDLGAVIKAILLDDEARSCGWISDPEHGKLKEPILRFTQLYKAFNISSSQGTFYSEGLNIEESTGQGPLRAPHVFNFYQYNYSPPGILGDLAIAAPEFQIFNSSTSIGYVNMIDTVVVLDQPLLLDQGIAQLNFDEEIQLSGNAAALVDHLDIKLTNGTLKNHTKTIVIDAINQLSTSASMDKVKMAIYLITASPEFNVLK